MIKVGSDFSGKNTTISYIYGTTKAADTGNIKRLSKTNNNMSIKSSAANVAQSKEIYKDIPGYEGYYQVSNFGNVRSLNYNRERRVKVLKQGLHIKGYKVVYLSKYGKQKTLKVHRLVLLAFEPNANKLPQVNHINGIKSDNRLVNLEWSSNSRNQKHAWALGLNKGNTGIPCSENRKRKIGDANRGGKNGGARKVLDTSTGKVWGSIVEASAFAKISYSTLHNYLTGCCKNKTTFIYD